MICSHSSRLRFLAFITLSVLCSFSFHGEAFAYAGLGPLVPMIGSGIVLLFACLVTVLGLVIYPIKRILAKLRKKDVTSKVLPTQ